MKNLLSKHLNPYRIAVLLSAISFLFGIVREFIIVGLLGFTATNDILQLYLSIFYTIGLSIDAMRLACLNLYPLLSLSRILLSASLIALLFSCSIGFIMSYSTGELNLSMLCITLLGGYLNLIAALLITYKQRNNTFLLAQLINVMPNFILIPGILICYWFLKTNLIFSIICLTSLIPVVQCSLLFLLPNKNTDNIVPANTLSLSASILIFARHFSAMIGEQLFQMIARSAFFNFGAGYLSVFAIIIRLYSAVRFILIDSFIGSKLPNWQKQLQHTNTFFMKMVNSTYLYLGIAFIALMISIHLQASLIHSSIQMGAILILGFYFSTLVRIIYFKINHHENNAGIVTRFALFELLCAFTAFLVTKELNSPILAMLWIGYIAKPFGQLLLLRRKYYELL